MQVFIADIDKKPFRFQLSYTGPGLADVSGMGCINSQSFCLVSQTSVRVSLNL